VALVSQRRRARFRRIIGQAGAVAVGASVANALGYVLTVVAARRLGPAEFGAFSALLALIIVGNVAALAVQAMSARNIARGQPPDDTVAGGLGLAVVVGLGLAGLTPVLSGFLSLPSPVAAVAAAIAIAAMTATGPALGMVQGHERFRALGVLVAGQAALRVAGGLIGMALSPTAAGALVGMAVGMLVAGVIAWLVARPPVRRGGTVWPALVATLGAGGLLLGFVVMTNADVVLARHVLTPEQSGIYGAGAIFTKIAFWLPQFVPLVAFPALADPARRRSAIRLGLAAVVACGGVLVLAAAIYSRPAVILVAGDQYVGLAPWVAGFTALGALFAVSQLLVYAHLASGDRATTVVVWCVLVAYITIVELTATSLAGVLFPALGAATLVAIWGLVRESTSCTRQHVAT
jgi:O-antigen/teichoic acid export membrane protein